ASVVACCSVQVEVGFWALVLVGELGEHEELNEQQIMDVLQYCYEELVKLGEQNCIVGGFETVIEAKQIHQVWQLISKEISFTNVPCMMVREAKHVTSSNVHSVWTPVEDLVASIKLLDRALADRCLEEMVI